MRTTTKTLIFQEQDSPLVEIYLRKEVLPGCGD
jgi:hypothetical protein